MKKLTLLTALLLTTTVLYSQTVLITKTVLNPNVPGNQFPNVIIKNGEYYVGFSNQRYRTIYDSKLEIFETKEDLTAFVDSLINFVDKVSVNPIGFEQEILTIIGNKGYKFILTNTATTYNPNYETELVTWNNLPTNKKRNNPFPSIYVNKPSVNITMLVDGGWCNFTEYGLRETKKLL
jgi:hypothetical protein